MVAPATLRSLDSVAPSATVNVFDNVAAPVNVVPWLTTIAPATVVVAFAALRLTAAPPTLTSAVDVVNRFLATETSAATTLPAKVVAPATLRSLDSVASWVTSNDPCTVVAFPSTPRLTAPPPTLTDPVDVRNTFLSALVSEAVMSLDTFVPSRDLRFANWVNWMGVPVVGSGLPSSQFMASLLTTQAVSAYVVPCLTNTAAPTMRSVVGMLSMSDARSHIPAMFTT